MSGFLNLLARVYFPESRSLHQQQEFAYWLTTEGHIARVLQQNLKWETYHGFTKSTVPEFTLLAAKFGFERPDDMLMEMVCISERVPNGCHVHHGTTAVVLFLGSWHGVEDPGTLPTYYLKYPGDISGAWYPIFQGQAILIPPGTVHDFAPEPGRKLYFLSIQNPKLFHPETGKDDFHLTAANKEPYMGFRRDTRPFWRRIGRKVLHFIHRSPHLALPRPF